jgi:hypothetical protein
MSVTRERMAFFAGLFVGFFAGGMNERRQGYRSCPECLFVGNGDAHWRHSDRYNQIVWAQREEEAKSALAKK